MSARLRALAYQTGAIVEAGAYVAPSGRTVRIDEAVRAAGQLPPSRPLGETSVYQRRPLAAPVWRDPGEQSRP